MSSTATGQHIITRRVRGAILNWFDEHTVTPAEIYAQLQKRAGFGDDRDLTAHLRERHGEHAVSALQHGVTADRDRLWDDRLGELGRQLSSATTARARHQIWGDARPRLLLMHVPDPLFATAIEGACVRLPRNYDR